MLRFLRIRSLAVIEHVEVEFEPGFNVLTGETGAGKSILVEAVGLLLGERASPDLVRTGEAQATIEAIFEDGGEEIVVRRDISSQGRSRSFVNGALATTGALRDLSRRLVELHGQHEHQTLLDPATHLPLVDAYGGLDALVGRVQAEWDQLRLLREQLDRSRMDARERAARLDLIAFQLAEIERASPRPGEDEELSAARQILRSAERIRQLCSESYATLYDSDEAVLSRLGGVWKQLSELAAIDPQFAPFLDARDGIKSQLEDLAYFLRGYADSVDASPERLQEVEERLSLLERLKRKYGPTLQEVIDRGARLAREREWLAEAGDRAEILERELSSATTRYLAVARELSERRRTAAVEFARALEQQLAELAMSRTQFDVRFHPEGLPPEAWSGRGIDAAEFYISPNPGEAMRPLARIVSGGELSRVMLALKTLAAGAGAAGGAGKTLIFDEVDAGIGGTVAEVVGRKLNNLGRQFQVLCITHLAPIAARAQVHFRIEKAVRGSRTVTRVDRLDDDGRVDEIARMIAGASMTDAVKASARQLIGADSAVPASPTAKGKDKAKGESESRARRRS